VADSVDDADDADDEVDGLAGVPGTDTDFPPRFGQIRNRSEIIPLQGTAWVIDSFDSEPYDAAISFAWDGEAEQIVVRYSDDCATGRFTTNTTSQGGWVVVNDSPFPTCISPMTTIFSDGAIARFDREPDLLVVTSEGASLTATHWQSVSVHDEPLVVRR